MDDDENKFSVSISGTDRAVTFKGDDGDELGSVVAEALLMMRQPRECELAAHIALDLFNGMDSDESEWWPGYQNWLKAFMIAASEIEVGWKKHDEERDGKFK